MAKIARRRWIAAGLVLAIIALLGPVSLAPALADEREEVIEKSRRASAEIGQVIDQTDLAIKEITAALRGQDDKEATKRGNEEIGELERRTATFEAFQSDLDDFADSEGPRCCELDEFEESCRSMDREIQSFSRATSESAAQWSAGEYYETPENVWWAVALVLTNLSVAIGSTGPLVCR